MQRLLGELSERADIVLIDAPPVLGAADAVTLVPFVDSVLFVADARRMTFTVVGAARKELDTVGARMLGAVLNNYDPSKLGRMTYGYYRPFTSSEIAAVGVNGNGRPPQPVAPPSHPGPS
jgi:Mrp family chromosome partitioning ATPase